MPQSISNTLPEASPFSLVSVAALTARAQDQLHRLPKDKNLAALVPVFTSIVNDLVDFSRVQHEINRKIQTSVYALPQRHGGTHRGGSDSIAGTTDPTEIQLDTESAIGTPQLGFAPINHNHGTSELHLLTELEGAVVDVRDELAVEDVTSRRILEEILVATINLKQEILGWFKAKSNPLFREPTWEDLRFPAQGINPVGGAAPPAVGTTGLLEFSGNVDNIIGGFAQMSHMWVEGSTVRPHLHLIVPASNAGTNSRWLFEYNRGNLEGDFELAYKSFYSLPVVTAPNPERVTKHLLVEFGNLPMSGYTHSAGIQWQITRLSNSDALDDDTGIWVLAEFDIHYQLDRTGTFYL